MQAYTDISTKVLFYIKYITILNDIVREKKNMGIDFCIVSLCTAYNIKKRQIGWEPVHLGVKVPGAECPENWQDGTTVCCLSGGQRWVGWCALMD